jgi:hypothetical protein
MAESVRLRLETAGDNIVITLPGTSCSVTYRKPVHSPGLVAANVRGDRDAPISQADFLARAWRIANDKARELGWIV